MWFHDKYKFMNYLQRAIQCSIFIDQLNWKTKFVTSLDNSSWLHLILLSIHIVQEQRPK